MIVGFVVTDYKGHQKDAVEYIKKVCILEDPDIAQNIVDAGPGVNIFSRVITIEDLAKQPFETSLIETTEGKVMIVSIVNFPLEFIYRDRVVRLKPAEYINVDPDEEPHFSALIKLGVVKTIK